VFRPFRRVLDFEHGLLLLEVEAGALECVEASLPRTVGTRWSPRALFRRVADGEAVPVFRPARIPEWAEQPPEVRAEVASALHGPIQYGGRRGVIILTHRAPRAFGREDARRLRRFGLLAAQVLAYVESRRLRNENAALDAARRAAEEVSRAKTAFLATMSHELRTPMTGILGVLDLLDPGGLDDRQRRHVEILRRSAEALHGLVDEVLDYTKMEAGALHLERRDFDLEALIEETCALFRASAQNKGLELRRRWRSGGVRWVRGDPHRLRQVSSNLLSNALKFTEAGHVELRGWAGPDGDAVGVELEVEDTGPGIPEARRARLFEPFAQADGTIARRYGGTGLGLAICRSIVDAMGGSIEVGGAPGEGAVFRVRLTLERGEAPAPGGPLPIGPGRSLSLLLVDDNPINQTVIEAALASLGHEVRVAGDGPSAVEAVRAGGLDAVLLDVHMPEMDGPATLRAIRGLDGRPGQVPVLVLTADVSEDLPARFEDLDVRGYLTKPVEHDELRAALARL
jgi:signal transduction histidine kinase